MKGKVLSTSVVRSLLAVVLVVGLLPLPAFAKSASGASRASGVSVDYVAGDATELGLGSGSAGGSGSGAGTGSGSGGDSDDVGLGAGESSEERDTGVKPIDASAQGNVEFSASIEGASEPFYLFRLLVGLKPGSTPRAGDVLLGSYGNVVLLGYSSLTDMNRAQAHYERTELFAVVDGALEATDTHDNATDARCDNARDAVPASGSNNALSNLQELVAQVDSSGVPAQGAGGLSGGKLVALVDTGVPPRADVVQSVSMLGGSAADDNGHGAHMLDVLIEQHPGVDVLSIKALDASGTGSVASVYAGIEYAVAAGADIINLSLSGWSDEANQAIQCAVDDALAAKATVVAAAGNGGYDANLFSPANVQGVYTVGAAEGDSIRTDSNRGSCVNGYVQAESSSEAAALVSAYLSQGVGVKTLNRSGLLARVRQATPMRLASTSTQATPDEVVPIPGGTYYSANGGYYTLAQVTMGNSSFSYPSELRMVVDDEGQIEAPDIRFDNYSTEGPLYLCGLKMATTQNDANYALGDGANSAGNVCNISLRAEYDNTISTLLPGYGLVSDINADEFQPLEWQAPAASNEGSPGSLVVSVTGAVSQVQALVSAGVVPVGNIRWLISFTKPSTEDPGNGDNDPVNPNPSGSEDDEEEDDDSLLGNGGNGGDNGNNPIGGSETEDDPDTEDLGD